MDKDLKERIIEELESLSAALDRAREAAGRLNYLFDAASGRPCGSHDPDSDTASGQEEAAAGRMTLRDFVREVLDRSRYAVPRDILRFRIVEDENGVKAVRFRLDQAAPYYGGHAFRYVEEFTVYAHRDMSNTVAEFDEAVGHLHLVRVPLKREDHDDWDSLD